MGAGGLEGAGRTVNGPGPDLRALGTGEWGGGGPNRGGLRMGSRKESCEGGGVAEDCGSTGVGEGRLGFRGSRAAAGLLGPGCWSCMGPGWVGPVRPQEEGWGGPPALGRKPRPAPPASSAPLPPCSCPPVFRWEQDGGSPSTGVRGQTGAPHAGRKGLC